MAEFDELTKLRIVLALAQFESPSEIVTALKAEGVDTYIQQIVIYDASKLGFNAGEKWRKIFEDERQRYMEEVRSIPIANQGYRLNLLQKMTANALKKQNMVLASSLLRQAAEEVGGVLTNERKNTNTNIIDELSADERRAQLADIVAQFMPVPKDAVAAPKLVQ